MCRSVALSILHWPIGIGQVTVRSAARGERILISRKHSAVGPILKLAAMAKGFRDGRWVAVVESWDYAAESLSMVLIVLNVISNPFPSLDRQSGGSGSDPRYAAAALLHSCPHGSRRTAPALAGPAGPIAGCLGRACLRPDRTRPAIRRSYIGRPDHRLHASRRRAQTSTY